MPTLSLIFELNDSTLTKYRGEEITLKGTLDYKKTINQ